MKRLSQTLLATCLLFLAAAVNAQDKNFYVFLCLGQSNMEGFPGIVDEDKGPVDDRLQMLAAVDFPDLGREKGHWYNAVPPLCRPNSGLSPADYFGRTLAAKLPKSIKVGVISVAVAGARIEVFDDARVEAYEAKAPNWMKGIIAAYDGSPYTRLVEMARLAQHDGVIKGILVHQGEANTGDTTWPSQVKSLYEKLLKDLNLTAADVPLIAGEVVGADQQGKCASMNPIIDSLPETIPTAHVVSSAGCECRPDHLHFTPAGYREFGRRYAAAMLPLLEQSARN